MGSGTSRVAPPKACSSISKREMQRELGELGYECGHAGSEYKPIWKECPDFDAFPAKDDWASASNTAVDYFAYLEKQGIAFIPKTR